MSRKIITLSGRQGSGKTEFASTAIEKYGFTKIAIADRLKEVVSELYEIPLNNLIDPILKQQELDRPWVWNKDIALKLEKITGLNLTLDIEEQEFKKPREALQYIGTDVIRLVDQDFHIKECIKKINYTNNNIVIDDQRFPSEREALQQFNPIEYFIVRPYNFEYSNHESEISLDRNMFDNVLWNRKNKQYLINTSSLILKTHTWKRKRKSRNSKEYWCNLLNEYGTPNAIANKLNLSSDGVLNNLRKYCIFYDNNEYNYDKNAFNTSNSLNSYVAGYLSGDCSISKLPRQYNYGLYLNSIDIESINKLRQVINTNKPYITKDAANNNQAIYRIEICSPSIIEDLKLWNITPRIKGMPKNQLPDIIKNNNNYMKYWISGLIDADGCISRDKYNRYSFDILGSQQIIDYIKNYLSIDNYTEYALKKSKQLIFLKYRGKAAEIAHAKLRNEYCLSRKWDKIKDLI